MTENEESWEGYETGPFCRHWGDPGDCEKLCQCGHRCDNHDYNLDYCQHCDKCKEFKDASA